MLERAVHVDADSFVGHYSAHVHTAINADATPAAQLTRTTSVIVRAVDAFRLVMMLDRIRCPAYAIIKQLAATAVQISITFP
jgi:hypothetical protein